MSGGLFTTGFVVESLDEIRNQIASSLGSVFGPAIAAAAISDETIIGQIVGILSERLALIWELGESIYNANDPDTASDARQDAICALTGTTRNPQLQSEATLYLTGIATTVIPIDSQASVVLGAFDLGSGDLADPNLLETGELFETTAEVTIAAATPWAPSTLYLAGAIVTNFGDDGDGNDRDAIFICTTGGVSAGSGGPTVRGYDILDSTAQWRWLGDGDGYVAAVARSVNYGPVEGPQYAVAKIETPVSGWLGSSNIDEATLGNLRESNAELRARREIELARAGTGTGNAIRSALINLLGVESVTIFVNNTDTTDADGVPPHAIEALVQGGTDQDIWDTLLDSVSAGTNTHGDEEGTAEDDAGVSHTMRFNRPDLLEIWIEIDAIIDPDTFPLDGADQIAENIVEWGNSQKTGKNAVASSFGARAFLITGVLDVTAVRIGTAEFPVSSSTIAVSLRQLAQYHVDRILVATTTGTP